MTNDAEWINTRGRFLKGELEAYIRTGTDLPGLIKAAETFTRQYCHRLELKPQRTEEKVRDMRERLLPAWLADHPKDDWWDHFTQFALFSIENAKDEPLDAVGLDEALGGRYDQAPYHEPDLEAIDEEVAKATVHDFLETRRLLFDRAEKCSSPLYQMILSDPEKHQALLALFVVLDPDTFEALVAEFAGETISFPSDKALGDFARDREIVESRNRGAKVEDLAAQHGLKSPGRVSQIVSRQRALRRDDEALERALIASLNRALRASAKARRLARF
ncbi:MAG: Mor transcription activator family protein [Acidobacteriota bacterium]